MDELTLRNWIIKPELESLLFFAQRFNELLFDFTLDSYKFPALYSTSICEELVSIIDKIERTEFNESSIEPIIQELSSKVRNDYIVKNLVKDNLDSYLSYSDIRDIKDIRVKTELLKLKITPEKYISECKQVLKSLIIENKRKELIDSILPNFISALIDFGYSQNYLYIQTLKFFFSSEQKQRIDNVALLDNFFKIFDLKPKEYKVIFIGAKIYQEIQESVKIFNIELHDNFYPKTNKVFEKDFLETKKKHEIFLECTDVVALDPQSAKNNAEKRLNNLSKLFRFFHHKQKPYWSLNALIYEDKSMKIPFLLKTRISPMYKCIDDYPDVAAKKLNALIKNFGIESHSFFKFDRSLDLHSLSLENKYVENQVLQNWIAFESLLVGYSQKSKIEQVIEALLPSLKLYYLSKIIINLTNDLERWDNAFFNKKLELVINCNNNVEKMASIVILDKYKSIREDFYKSLTSFPLLKYRLYKIHKDFSNVQGIWDFYKNHEQKVTWQIKRIYRTRNLIVHTGYVPTYSDILVENSHNYLDILLNQIIDLVINGQFIESIHHGIKEIQIQQMNHEKYIKSQLGKDISEDNIKKLIFPNGIFVIKNK